MTELNEHFSHMEKNNAKKEKMDGKPSYSAMSSCLYFLIPVVVFTSINVFFFYNVSAALSYGLKTSIFIILPFLIALYLASKLIVIKKLAAKEKVLISGALHILFIVICLITLLIPFNSLYVKGLLVIWCFFKSKEMLSNFKIMWNSYSSLKTKNLESEKRA